MPDPKNPTGPTGLTSPDDLEQIEDLWAVVPAGGAGTRLWPLSRAASPKFLHDLTGVGHSLLQGTRDRLAPLVGPRLLVVTGRAHRDAVTDQLGLADDAVLVEPAPRDSMAAIGLAAAVLERRDPDAVMGSFAADHVITDETAFGRAVRTAAVAARAGWLVTIGIEATHPSTSFGYIHLGDPLADVPGAHRVQEFVEKPSTQVATDYLATGRYRWNAGMFVVRPSILLDLLAATDPVFTAALRAVAADPGTLEEVWPTLPRIALDHAVAEPAAADGRVAVVPASLGWDDVGDYDSLAELLARVVGDRPDRSGPLVLGDAGLVRHVDATGLVVPAGGRTVAVVGLEDVVVVDTPDALLVTTRARAQQVKDVVTGLRATGRQDLT